MSNDELKAPVPKSDDLTITKKNLLIWKDWHDGVTIEDIMKEYDIKDKAVYYHIRMVDKFFEDGGKQWTDQARNRMRARFSEVLGVFDDAIMNKDRKTMNKYLDKMVYPQKSEKPIGFQMNVEKIAASLNIGGFEKQRYDDNVEIIDIEEDGNERITTFGELRREEKEAEQSNEKI